MRHFTQVVLGVVAAAVITAPAAAQDVRWTTVTKLELGGGLGRMMRLMPGLGDPVRETVYYSGLRMRTDDDRDASSTIMNAEDGSITWLDHESKTYRRMAMGDMVDAMRGARAGMAEAMEEAQEQAEEERAGEMPADSVRYEVHFSTDRTGERERIAGYEAEQVVLTVEIVGETYAEEGDSVIRGSLVVLTELWLSEGFPGHAAERAFQEAWAGRMMDDLAVGEEAEDMSAIFAHDPRIREGLERLQEQLGGLEGTTLRTVSHFVSVPDGVEFDREKVIADAGRSLLADVGEGIARGAARGARRRLGRLLGGRNREENREPEPKQVVIMRTTSEVEEVGTGTVPVGLFSAPADYGEREGMRGTGR